MSFGNRMRAQRTARTGALTVIAALAASMGMSTTLTPPTTTPASVGVGEQSQAPKEFVDEKTRRRRPAPVTNRVKGGRGGLRARVDSRKARRRFLMLMLGVENSGRQWVRTRRDLRRYDDGRWLLAQPAWRLKLLAVRMGKVAA